MAVKFWVPLSSATVNGNAISVSPLNKQTTGDVDETDRLQINATGDSRFTLSGTPSSIVTGHGDITSVKMHFRIYYSNNGPVDLDTSELRAMVAPFITVDGTTHYNLPDYQDVGGLSSQCGYDFTDYTKNFNQPGEPVAKVCAWDMSTILGVPADWNDTKLNGCTFGLKMTNTYLGPLPYRYSGTAPLPGGAGNTPRHNITQCILEVDALDVPAPPVVTKPMLMVIG
jgi:hypothetical protein